jgi:hypothetical protein
VKPNVVVLFAAAVLSWTDMRKRKVMVCVPGGGFHVVGLLAKVVRVLEKFASVSLYTSVPETGKPAQLPKASPVAGAYSILRSR